MKTIFSIPGIHCTGCAQLITDVSSEQAGVLSTVVHQDTKQVVVDHDDSFDAALWQKEIEALDPKYKVTDMIG